MPSLADRERSRGTAHRDLGDAHLPVDLLTQNAIWFYRLRWLVIALLLAIAALGEQPELVGRLGLALDWRWPLAVAAVLTALNAGLVTLILFGGTEAIERRPKLVLWVQIAVDLVALTVVIHFVGSLESFAAFAYLCHIVLACLFFPRRQSFVVTALAVLLYLACVAAEAAGLLPPGGLLQQAPRAGASSLPVGHLILHVGMALSIWLAVWYLTSRLSAEVRVRDDLLEVANRRLLASASDRARHMLRTTHELKAPLAAIHANTQLLQGGYVGALGREADEVVGKIAVRCRALSRGVQQMLQLANLTSSGQPVPRPVELDLAAIVAWAVQGIGAEAGERGVTIDAQVDSCRVRAVEDHMKMLFGNIVTNAVTYSRPGGAVWIRGAWGRGGSYEISVRDEGIGIEPTKLARIFDQYFRTQEGGQHNPASTGLGLSIVQQVAQAENFGVTVESAPGRGSTFTVKVGADRIH